MIADGAARRFAGVWSTHRPQPTTPSFGVGLWNLAFGRTARVETYVYVVRCRSAQVANCAKRKEPT
jgi:hypothetical protein